MLIVGAGLAGGLLALALRELQLPVAVVDPALSSPLGPLTQPSASRISYGAIPGWPLAPTPLARLAAGASRRWQQLERRHGSLGWQRRRLRLQGDAAALPAISRFWPLPFSQVDGAQLMAALPRRQAAAGVALHGARVETLERDGAAGWQLRLASGELLRAPQVVLAAGAGVRALWPAVPAALRCSWAAVLQLDAFPPVLGRAAAWLPQRFQRVALEQRAAELQQPEWLVDVGLVPWASGALLGQHSLVRPGLACAAPPEAAATEAQLRQALAAHPWGSRLAALPAQLLQAPVAFCPGGRPLVGPLPEAEGLWLFSGFSAAFSQVPVLAPLLAPCLAGSGGAAAAAERRLQQLGVWPAGG